MIRSRMCADLSEHCMVSNRHREHGTLKLKFILVDWASPKVNNMRTYITLW